MSWFILRGLCVGMVTTFLFKSGNVAAASNWPPSISLDTFVPSRTWRECCDLIDSAHWDVEFSNFETIYRELREGETPTRPLIQILKLSDSFKDTDGSGIPCMRIAAVFPAVEPETLFSLLTNCELRKKWDFNYRMFERFPSLLTSSTQENGHSSIELSDSLLGNGKKEAKTLLLDRGWFMHQVGSTFLSKLGVGLREFLYFRWSFSHCFTFDKSDRFTAYSIIYDGSQEQCALPLKHERFSQWSGAKSGASSKVSATMNYQHILLVPFVDHAEQIQKDRNGVLYHLFHSGSCSQLMGSNSLISFLQDCDTINRLKGSKIRTVNGTVFLITSVNQVGISNAIPDWMRKKISSTVTTKVYSTLMEAALEYQNNHAL